MSQSRTEQKLMSQYLDFVVEHADRAVRWEAEDSKGLIQLKYAEFAVQNNDSEYVEPGAAGNTHYYMDLYVKLSLEERRETGQRSAGILVDFNDDNGFEVIDEFDHLRPWVGDCATEGTYNLRAAGLLLREVEQVEAEGLIVPAGRRRPELDATG